MATNNMAMILLAGGAAIIGATIFLKPKDEKPPPPGERTGLTVAQILAAEEAEEKIIEKDAGPRRGDRGPVIGQSGAGPVIVALDEPTFIRVTGI